MKHWSVLLFVVVLALVVLWMPADAWAGPPPPTAKDTGALLQLLKQMRTSVAVWQEGGQAAARVAFAALASLSLAWLGVELFSSQGDIRTGLGKLARELVVLSVFYSLIELGPDLARQVVDFLRHSADGIVAKPGEDQVWNALQNVVDASLAVLRSGEAGAIELLWLGLCVLAVMGCVGLTGAIMLVTEAATELIIGLGAIVLGGGGAIWTRFLVQNYLKFSCSAGLALYVMRFVQSFVISNLKVWSQEAKAPTDGVLDVVSSVVVASFSPPTAAGAETMFTLLLTVIVQLGLVGLMPVVALVLVNGSVGRVAEWAGSTVQRLAANGMQNLGQMRSAPSAAGGAARGAASAGAGQGLSMLGSTGGAVPPAGGGGGASGAREQGSGSARGVDPATRFGGGLSEGGSAAAPIGADAGGDGQAVGDGVSAEARDCGDAQRGGSASAFQRAAPAGSATSSGAGGGGAAGGATSAQRARGDAGEGSNGRSSSRSAWSGQAASRTSASLSRESGAAAAESARSAAGFGQSESQAGRDGARQEGGGGGSGEGGSGSAGAVGDGSGGHSGNGGAQSSSRASAGSAGSGPTGAGAGGSGAGQARGSSQAPSAAPRASRAGAAEGPGASRGASGAGMPASSPASPPARPGASLSAASAPAGGQMGAVQGAASMPAPAAPAAGRGGAVTPAPAVAAGGRTGGQQQGVQGAQRVAAAGPSARGVAGKRGEHG